MKKVLSFTLPALALAALASPTQAQFGGSVRGDVGALGNQLPYFTVQTGRAPVTEIDKINYISRRAQGQWEFTGRIFAYTSCAPCATYIAGSWQGSNHKVHSCRETITEFSFLTNTFVVPELAVRIVDAAHVTPSQNATIVPDVAGGMPVISNIEVKNKFSKAKLGFGLDLIKTSCFAFTMEMGGNYLDAQLDSDKTYTLTQTAAEGPGCINIQTFSLILLCSPPADGLPFNFVIHDNTWQKTEGVGLYASFKADYKLPATCLGNCFGIYAKAEVADIIGRQKYSNRICTESEFNIVTGAPIVPPEVFIFNEHVCNRYNNVVEVDLELALVYSPCFKCWENLNLDFSLGIRTDSFVNLFSKPIVYTDVSYLSLTRPTVFLELGIKV